MRIGKYPVNTGGAFIVASIAATDIHSFKTSIEQIYSAGVHAVSIPPGLEDIIYKDVLEFCGKIGICVFSSPENSKKVALLNTLEIDSFEVSQYNLNNDRLLEAIKETGKPVVLSTEGRLRTEVDYAMSLLEYDEDVALLHSIPIYPTPLAKCNLSAITKLKRYYNRQVGWEDHTGLVTAPLIAYVLGASIIKVFFASATPIEYAFNFDKLKSLVSGIVTIKSMIGNKVPLTDKKG